MLVLLQNGAGSQTLSVPVNPAVTGYRFYAQWAVGSVVNAFGYVVSDAVAIQAR